MSDANPQTSPFERRKAIIRAYFRCVDERDAALFDLCADNVEIYFPKFGLHRGKDALRAFGARMGGMLAWLAHDIDGLVFVDGGDTIVVEGREWGETVDGMPFPNKNISDGRFCNVFRFDGALISSVRIYVDPDLASADAERVRLLHGDGLVE